MEIHTEGLNKIQSGSAITDLARLAEQAKAPINARVLSISPLSPAAVRALLAEIEQQSSSATRSLNNLAQPNDAKTQNLGTNPQSTLLAKLVNSFPATTTRNLENFQKTLSEMSLVKLALAQPQLKPFNALLPNKLLLKPSLATTNQNNLIQVGQKISISLSNDGLLKFNIVPSQNKPQQHYLSQNKINSAAQREQAPPSTPLNTGKGAQISQLNRQANAQDQIIKAINDTLRSTLPKNTGAEPLLKLVSSIPPSEIPKIISQLTTLSSKLIETQSLEKNIAQLTSAALQRIQNIPKLSQIAATDIQRATSNKNSTSNLQQAISIANGAAKNQTLTTPLNLSVNKTEESDLQILVHSHKVLTTLSTTLESKPSLLMDNFLKAIFALLKPKESRNNTQQPVLRDLNLAQLETSIRAAINHSITAQLKTAIKTLNDPQSPMYYFAEIPARFNELVLPIGIHIQEKYIANEKKKDSEKKSKKQQKKKWTLNLEWNIPEYGEFKAEINYSDKALNTAIWTEKKSLRKQIREKLPTLKSTLANLGIDVKQLTCLETRPMDIQGATTKTSLVDITT